MRVKLVHWGLRKLMFPQELSYQLYKKDCSTWTLNPIWRWFVAGESRIVFELSSKFWVLPTTCKQTFFSTYLLQKFHLPPAIFVLHSFVEWRSLNVTLASKWRSLNLSFESFPLCRLAEGGGGHRGIGCTNNRKTDSSKISAETTCMD